MKDIATTHRSGSTVHWGGLECEVFHCYEARERHGGPGERAAVTCWLLDDFRGRPVRTFVMCRNCLVHSLELDGTEPLYFRRPLYLDLLSPEDPYAVIAVSEMLYALTALLVFVRERASRRFMLDVAPKKSGDQWWKKRIRKRAEVRR